MTMPLMAGKQGLIMGVANERSLGWGIAKTLHAHGAGLAFTYQGEALGKRVKPLAASVGADLVLPCDVEDIATVDALFAELSRAWGTLDFLVHAGGAASVVDAAYRFARHEAGSQVVLFGTGNRDHLRSNIDSILGPPLPAADVAKLYECFGALRGVGLDLPDRAARR